MRYEKIYNQLIEKRRKETPQGYTEKHHILPRSLGGSDDPENIIELTLREHFVAHLLLVKMTEGADKIKMADAVWGFMARSGFRPNSHTYQIARSDFSKAASARAKKQWQDGKTIPPPDHKGTTWWHKPGVKKHKRSVDCPGPGWVKGKHATNKDQFVKVFVNGIEFQRCSQAAEYIGCSRSVISGWRDKGKPYAGKFLITSTPIDIN